MRVGVETTILQGTQTKKTKNTMTHSREKSSRSSVHSAREEKKIRRDWFCCNRFLS